MTPAVSVLWNHLQMGRSCDIVLRKIFLTFTSNYSKVLVYAKVIKGELISKTICGVLDSPKKRTKTI